MCTHRGRGIRHLRTASVQVQDCRRRRRRRRPSLWARGRKTAATGALPLKRGHEARRSSCRLGAVRQAQEQLERRARFCEPLPAIRAALQQAISSLEDQGGDRVPPLRPQLLQRGGQTAVHARGHSRRWCAGSDAAEQLVLGEASACAVHCAALRCAQLLVQDRGSRTISAR